MVTLTGVGGVGKTRLALQVAGEVSPRFRDGAWLCELAAVRDPGGVVRRRSGSVPGERAVGAELGGILGRVPARPASCSLCWTTASICCSGAAGLVVAIEAACRGVRVLATSREGLNIAGEQILVVPSFGAPRRRRHSNRPERVRGGAPVRGSGPGGQGRLHRRCDQPGRRGGGVHASRRCRVGDRAGRGADPCDEPERVGPAPRPTVPAPQRRRARSRSNATRRSAPRSTGPTNC